LAQGTKQQKELQIHLLNGVEGSFVDAGGEE